MNGALTELWKDLNDPNVLWQVGTLLICILSAYWLSVPVRARLMALRRPDGAAPVSAGVDVLVRASWPLLALALVVATRPVLARWHHVNLLHLAVPLLASLAAARALVYIVQRAVPRARWAGPAARLAAAVVWTGAALHVLGLDRPLLEALDGTVVPIGKNKVSLLTIAQAALSVGVTMLLALWAGRALEARLMGAESLDSSLRAVLARFGRAVLVLVAVLVSLSMVGLDLTVLSVFGGALGVGLGLGLQRIASNYVSGFIILLDRGLRLGDLITVDKYSGRVTQIKTRYTILRAADGTEAVIPNELLIAQPVLNQSFSDPKVRLVVNLQIAYDADIDAAFALMRDAASRHPRVLADPGPQAFLTGFASDGLNVELGFWIQDPLEGTLNVRSDVSRAVLAAFGAAGIEIPFPQRELRMRAGPPGEAGEGRMPARDAAALVPAAPGTGLASR